MPNDKICAKIIQEKISKIVVDSGLRARIEFKESVSRKCREFYKIVFKILKIFDLILKNKLKKTIRFVSILNALKKIEHYLKLQPSFS